MSKPATVIVRGGEANFLQEIEAGTHVLIADEPESYGGTNLGPNPYDLLLASLGACTSMTLSFYARKHRIPLASVEVRLRHDREHEKDCEKCEDEPRRIDRLTRQIKLVGDLNAEQRERLLEIADRCPVHRTLTGNLEVTTSLIEDEDR